MRIRPYFGVIVTLGLLAFSQSPAGVPGISSVQAQTLAINGRVTSPPADTGTPISGVTLTLVLNGSSQSTTQTDNSGNFTFSAVPSGSNYDVTPSKTGFIFQPSSQGGTNLISNRTLFFTGTATINSVVQFGASSFSISEQSGSLPEIQRAAYITVIRTGDLSGTSSVNYATSDGSASQRTDYSIASGTITFGPSENSKTFPVLIIDNAFVDGTRNVNLELSTPVGATLGNPATAVLSISDNDSGTATTNPIDDSTFFVRQHYYDFLSRVPDEGGLTYWSSVISSCGTDTLCIDSRRVGVSAAYFIELEFQETGGFVYRFYKASFGVRPTYAQFMPDRSSVVAGANLDAGKAAFAEQWVQRSEFLQKYPPYLTGTQFIDALLQTIQQGSGVNLNSQRTALIDEYNAHGSRARVLQMVAENADFKAAEYNNAFVLMQYFGYLRRDPDDGGYAFWLNILNNGQPNNFRGMVCAFLTSAEYQTRFSPVITRTDRLCGQAAQ